MLGKIAGQRRMEQLRMRWPDTITDSVAMNLSKLLELMEDRGPGVVQSVGSPRVRYNSVTAQPCQVSAIIPHFTGMGGMLCSGHRPGACLEAGNNTEANFFSSLKNVFI